MQFKKVLQKELLFYLLTLVTLALVMHIDLISDPFARLETMQEKGNYSHPFLYSFIIYGIILILRKVIDFIVGLFEKKSEK